MTPQQAWQHDGCADMDSERYVLDFSGEPHRAQRRIVALQRFALFGLAAAIVLLVLICF